MTSRNAVAQVVNVVVVGDGFKPSMIEAADFFGGALDQEQTIVQNAFCQFRYRSNTYDLSVVPNRVSIRTTEPDLLSPDFVSNVKHLFGVLDRFRGAVSVSAWGINCSADFVLGVLGAEYCNDLVDGDRFNHLLCGDKSGAVSAWLKGLVEYRDLMMTVRIEPKVDSEGRNLFVAVNGNREVSDPNEKLASSMENSMAQFREYVEALHERITST